MAPTFRAYIDESGDEGFKFGSGSTDWFVMSAVVTRDSDDAQAVRLIDELKHSLGKPSRRPLHYRRLSAEHKVMCAERVARGNLRAMSVMFHKPSLRAPETFTQPHRLYFYTTRYLIERISWYCRDQRRSNDQGDGSARLIFGKREGMPYPDMQDYVRKLYERREDFSVQIAWPVIRPDQVEAAPMGRFKGLQIADCVAGSFFCGLDETRNVPRDHCCALALKPVTYHHFGKYVGYGLKVFPHEVNPSGLALIRAWLAGEAGTKAAAEKPKAGPGPQDPAPSGAAVFTDDLR